MLVWPASHNRGPAHQHSGTPLPPSSPLHLPEGGENLSPVLLCTPRAPGLALTCQVWERAVAAVPSPTPRRSLPGTETWGPKHLPGQASPPLLTLLLPSQDAPFTLRQPRLFQPLAPFIGHFTYTMSCNPRSGRHSDPHFTEEDTEARRGGVTGTRSAVQKGAARR